MNLIKRFAGWISFKPLPTVKFGNPELHPINTESLARELDLLGEARRMGERGLPSADTVMPTGVEHKVIQIIQKARQDYTTWAASRLNALDQDINSLDLHQITNRAKGSAAEYERKANSLLASFNPTLRDLSQEVASLKIEFNEFRKLNSLTRTPHYPAGNESALRWSILVFLVLCEGIANAVFFAKGLESGLVDGFLNALLFAFLNVGFAVLVGSKLIPFIFHNNLIKKTLSILLLPIGLFVSLIIALGTAHYRDQLGIDPQNASKLALDTIGSAPFELMEFHSWVLFGLSLIFGIIAMYDAFGLDDQYPGYGKLHRRLELAVADYDEEMDAKREDLESLKDDSLKGLDEFSEKAKSVLRKLDDSIQHKITTKTRLDLAFKNADYCLDTLLHMFRGENRMYRDSQDVPEYFNTKVALDEIKVPDFSVEENKKKYSEQVLLVKGFEGEIEPIRKKIQASFNTHFSDLKPIDEHFHLQELS